VRRFLFIQRSPRNHRQVPQPLTRIRCDPFPLSSMALVVRVHASAGFVARASRSRGRRAIFQHLRTLFTFVDQAVYSGQRVLSEDPKRWKDTVIHHLKKLEGSGWVSKKEVGLVFKAALPDRNSAYTSSLLSCSTIRQESPGDTPGHSVVAKIS
jgi:hypothetical protein